MNRMKRMIGVLLCAAMLLSLTAIGASAIGTVSNDVNDDSWKIGRAHV